MPDNAPLSAAPDAVMLLDPTSVLFAVYDPTRHGVLRQLATGAQFSVNDLAARVNRPADSVTKHLRILRDARLVRVVDVAGADGRKQYHEVPSVFRACDAAGKTVLDFGAVVLRFG